MRDFQFLRKANPDLARFIRELAGDSPPLARFRRTDRIAPRPKFANWENWRLSRSEFRARGRMHPRQEESHVALISNPEFKLELYVFEMEGFVSIKYQCGELRIEEGSRSLESESRNGWAPKGDPERVAPASITAHKGSKKLSRFDHTRPIVLIQSPLATVVRSTATL
jgi:hypothetical protein